MKNGDFELLSDSNGLELRKKSKIMGRVTADENNKLDVTFQLRNNGKVVFQTK